MAVNTRANVSAPAKAPLTYGLASVAEVRPEPVDNNGRTDPHWRNGIEWTNVCPDANSTYDACISAASTGVSGVATPPEKTATASRSLWGATPFTLFVEVDCATPIAAKEDFTADVEKAFAEAEAVDLETVFFTGQAGGQTLAFPHLAASTAVLDGRNTLQLAAANVGPTGAAILDVVEAMGKLESALSNCVRGVGVIYVPAELLPHLVAWRQVKEENGVYYSPAGHKISASPGYLGTAPDGTVTANVKWIYGTGPVFMYRSVPKFYADVAESTDRSVNTTKRIFERTYVLGYDCCLFAVAVSTGGIITGSPGTST